MAADPSSRLAAVASRSLERAEAFAAAHGAERAYGSYDELLADPGVDAILIATPNALHPEQVVQAASAGKHVFCDKPLALDPADADRAVAACAEAGVKLGVNFEFRHAAPYRAIREAVQAGEIGDVLIVHVESSGGVVPHRDWRGDPELAGLGTTTNIGIHLYDVLEWTLGSPIEEVTAFFDVGDRAGEVMETTALALLRFANGTMAHVNANQTTAQPANDVVLHGSEGRILSRGLGSLAYLLRNGLPAPPVHIAGRDGERTVEEDVHDVFVRSLGAFARAVLEDREPDPAGADGVRSAQVAQAISDSARTRRHVQVATVAGAA